MIPYQMIIGGAMDTVGTAIMASGADKRKRQQEELANTPGIDFGALTQEQLDDMLKYLPQGSEVARRIAESNQSTLNAQEESALPGIGAARKTALGNITGLFSDDADWLKGVQRRGAALGLSSGLFGSAAGQVRTLKLSDTEKMARTQLGTGLLGSLISSMRIASSPGVQAFLGPSMSDRLTTRSNERQTRLGMLSAAAGMPSYWETWGQRLQQAGSTLAGSSMGGGGGWGSTSMSPSSGSNDFTMQNYNQMLENGQVKQANGMGGFSGFSGSFGGSGY